MKRCSYACIVATASLQCCARHQASDQTHSYLSRPTIIQPDGLDGVHRTKAAQQMWLNTEQWYGYSDTYLQRFMQYPSGVEHPNPCINTRNPMLEKCLKEVFDLYGPCAELLHKLHADPLHPRFHEWVARVRAGREKIANVLDENYSGLHPTVKTVWDAHLVRRYYLLEDWAKHVEKKRATFFERMSPEHIEFMLKAKGLSDDHMMRLEKLKTVFEADPAAGLLPEGYDYSEDEVAMIKQKAKYFRNMRRFGNNRSAADMRPV